MKNARGRRGEEEDVRERRGEEEEDVRERRGEEEKRRGGGCEGEKR